MSRSTRAKWWHAAGWSAVALLVTAQLVVSDLAVLAAPVLVLCLLCAYLTSPLAARRSTGHWQALQRHVRHSTVVVYWRPGCVYCLRLRLALWRARVTGTVDWVDIWDDPGGAAYVRDLNDGSETVPTVIFPDGSARTNPDPASVVAAARSLGDGLSETDETGSESGSATGSARGSGTGSVTGSGTGSATGARGRQVDPSASGGAERPGRGRRHAPGGVATPHTPEAERAPRTPRHARSHGR